MPQQMERESRMFNKTNISDSPIIDTHAIAGHGRLLALLAAVTLAAPIAMTGCSVGADELGELDGERGDASRFNWPLVRIGDLDRNVVALQYLLRHHGEQAPATGLFDEATEAAVMNFQRNNRLVVDGIVGKNSWQKLIVMVRSGSTGNAVRAVQDLLSARYEYDIEVNGVFDATTVDRALAFQGDKCLTWVDAIVGPETWYMLLANVSKCTGGSGGGSLSAQRILDAHQRGDIQLWDQTFGRYDGADPLSNITDYANGQPAKTSCYGNAPCNTTSLSDKMLVALEDFAYNQGHDYFITSMVGASHSVNSYHYKGRAADFDRWDGNVIDGDSSHARALMEACRQSGAIEVLGPSNHAGHQTHVHCAW